MIHMKKHLKYLNFHFSGCLLYKEARFEEALNKFNGAQQVNFL